MSAHPIRKGAQLARLLTPAQANEYWITVRRDHYWLDRGVPWDEAARRARHDWATIHPNGEGTTAS